MKTLRGYVVVTLVMCLDGSIDVGSVPILVSRLRRFGFPLNLSGWVRLRRSQQRVPVVLHLFSHHLVLCMTTILLLARNLVTQYHMPEV